MTSREIIKKLEKSGWICVGIKGSHRRFKHPTKEKFTIVPFHAKDIPIGTVKAIEKQTGVSLSK